LVVQGLPPHTVWRAATFGRASSNAAIPNLENVGFTFGGTFAGHGVFVTGGSARFVLKKFSVSP
jgi:hypothetical protein